jgi:hypothetical protein
LYFALGDFVAELIELFLVIDIKIELIGNVHTLLYDFHGGFGGFLALYSFLN